MTTLHTNTARIQAEAPTGHESTTAAVQSSPLRELLHLLGSQALAPETGIAGMPIALRRMDEDAALLHEGAPAHSLYVLRSGSVKCVKTLEDGYEQVLSFALPGDVLGFDALCSGRQPATVVALEVSTAFALPLQGLRELRQACQPLDDALQRALSRQLQGAAELTEMMAAVASDVRLARFLLWTVARMTEIGRSPRRLLLRMGRRDIASLLGVAHETVSRSFTAMADAGWLKVDNREVEILDLDRLKARARCTRGLIDAGAIAHHHNGAVHHVRTPQAWCPPAPERVAAPRGYTFEG